jgi:prepilin-type N-terminal cleavage/methylation domain-containing protein
VSRAVRVVGDEKGYTMIELLVTMVILGTVLAGLTTVFLSGTNAEAQLNHRFQAQLQARTALDKIRYDIHCATAAQAQTISTYPGLKIADGNCFASTPTISWCVVQVLASPPQYRLYRSTATTNTCASSDTSRLLVADYLTSSSVFTTSTIPQYSLQTVGVNLTVSANLKTKTAEVYKLSDSIVARSSTRCTTSGGCAAPTVP